MHGTLHRLDDVPVVPFFRQDGRSGSVELHQSDHRVGHLATHASRILHGPNWRKGCEPGLLADLGVLFKEPMQQFGCAEASPSGGTSGGQAEMDKCLGGAHMKAHLVNGTQLKIVV